MNRSCFKGFTLVELAVSMVVIGILLGMGMAMVGPLMTSIKVRESKENLAASVESVNSYASGNNRLPNVALLAGVVRAPQDAWGRDFIYLYDANLYAATPTKDTICGRRSSNITLTTTDPVATIPNVAYMMLSQGDDATTNTKIGATAVTTGAQATAVTVAANTTEDLVRWTTLDELRTKVGCQGAQLKIVNNELPFGAVPNAYSVTIVADGGVPFTATPNTYKWCVSTLPAGFSAQAGGIQNANCLDVNEATWGAVAASSTLTISFAANAVGLTSGAHQITVVVRDNADNVTSSAACSNASPGDNCASKVFVLTINPS